MVGSPRRPLIESSRSRMAARARLMLNTELSRIWMGPSLKLGIRTTSPGDTLSRLAHGYRRHGKPGCRTYFTGVTLPSATHRAVGGHRRHGSRTAAMGVT